MADCLRTEREFAFGFVLGMGFGFIPEVEEVVLASLSNLVLQSQDGVFEASVLGLEVRLVTTEHAIQITNYYY